VDAGVGATVLLVLVVHHLAAEIQGNVSGMETKGTRAVRGVVPLVRRWTSTRKILGLKHWMRISPRIFEVN
jgi:hypothetical protein